MKVIKIRGTNKNFILSDKDNETDDQIKASFYVMSERINASDDLKRKIDDYIVEEKKEKRVMKHFSIKKVMIGVAAACLVLGAAGIAGSGAVHYISGSSSIPSYTKFTDLPKAEAEVGYEADAIEAFKNGYEMKSIHISEESMRNEANQVIEKQKGIDLVYSKKGSETISLNICKQYASEREEDIRGDSKPDKEIRYGDTDVIFRQTTFKFVPVDYELTEEDKKSMEDGSVSISYGTSEVEMGEYYHVSWVKDGIVYGLGGFDLSISGDELLSMAVEIIESSIK